MRRSAGTLGLGRNRSHAERPAVEVAAGNGKPETTNYIEDEPTSPGNSFTVVDVDKRILPFPAVPGRYNAKVSSTLWQMQHSNPRVYAAYCTIRDTVDHPCQPSNDAIINLAKRRLRYG